MLGYMDEQELWKKVEMCRHIGVRPVVVARMLPRSWIYEIQENHGGFALILKYQLYPWGFRELAREVRGELGLPVDAPVALEDGTMKRFTDWHEKNQ